MPTTSRSPRWYRPSAVARSLALRPHVYVSAAVVVVILLLLPRALSSSLRGVIAADAGFLVYLLLAWRVMATFSHETVRTRAARQDSGGLVILAIVLLAIGSSFVAIAGLLAEAKSAQGLVKLGLAGLAAGTVALSWLVVQVVFTFHYAHEYYSPEDDADGRRGGLDFPEDDCPDYWDFFYYATSIGATSQTSDVSITSKSLRRLTTLHAIASFFFNTAVLALAINIGSSLF
ncbi:MAG: DUF1345 domain-containing protein [Hyphomicrobiaceae bacterium]|nr:DUF1345 domain-containing protein [Hyphomicrobiaceae bacterium]